jgi:hypothetical protein
MRALLLVEESLDKQRQTADALRLASDRAAAEADKKAVASMREAADDTFKSALAGGILSIGSSLASAVSVGVQIGADGASAQAKKMSEDATKSTEAASAQAAKIEDAATATLQGSADTTTTAAKRMAEKAKELAQKAITLGHTAKVIEAGAGVAKSSGTAVENFMAAEVKRDDADRAQHELDAKQANRRSEDASESSKELQAIVDKTLQRLEEMLTARHQTNMALLRG